jgi:hypothetical protein
VCPINLCGASASPAGAVLHSATQVIANPLSSSLLFRVDQIEIWRMARKMVIELGSLAEPKARTILEEKILDNDPYDIRDWREIVEAIHELWGRD